MSHLAHYSTDFQPRGTLVGAFRIQKGELNSPLIARARAGVDAHRPAGDAQRPPRWCRTLRPPGRRSRPAPAHGRTIQKHNNADKMEWYRNASTIMILATRTAQGCWLHESARSLPHANHARDTQLHHHHRYASRQRPSARATTTASAAASFTSSYWLPRCALEPQPAQTQRQHSRAAQHSTAEHSRVEHSTEHSTAKQSRAQQSRIQHSTTQHSTAEAAPRIRVTARPHALLGPSLIFLACLSFRGYRSSKWSRVNSFFCTGLFLPLVAITSSS